MARNEQLIRQHKILQILERVRYGKSLIEIRDCLVDELGLTSLHTRSVRRDLEALQAAGIDVDSHDMAQGKVWKLGPRAKGAYKITASATELIALSVGRDLMLPLAGTPFWSGIESFWSKVREELPDPVLSHYEKYREVLYVLGTPAKSYERHHGILKTLNRSVLEHRVVEIDYQSVGKPMTTRRIEPYAIVLYQSSIYIIAGASEVEDADERVRHFKLDRFSKATALDEWFKIPAGFDLGTHLAHSAGIFSSSRPKNFRIRISAYAARWVIEDPWHPDQKIKQLDNGGIELSVKASHEMEIIPRVLAMGVQAELLAPVASRRKVARMIREMSDSYSDVPYDAEAEVA